MTRVYYYQEQFNSGQLGLLLRGRSDAAFYKNGCKTMKNFRPSVQGPAIKRKGTVYVSEVKTSSSQVRLQEFIFSEIDSYILEFGNSYIRFYQGSSQVESGGSPYEIVSPYAASDLNELKFAQLGDIMYITHPNYKPRKLSRLGATNWTIAEVDYKLGPVQDFNESSTTITLSGTLTEGGTSTWTASTSIFQASDVGTVWAIAKHDDKSVVGYAIMTTYTSNTVAEFTNQNNLTAVTTTASTNWKYPLWSDTYGWPRAVAFHEQRLFFAGNNESPLTVYGSTVGNFENFDIDDASADDALIFEIAGRVNTIQWLRSDGPFLVAGTYGGLGFIEFDLGADTVTPRAKVGTKFGSSLIQGVELGDRLVYAHSNNKALYEAAYDDITFKYQALDLNDINPDILDGGITEMKTIEQPDLSVVTVSSGNLDILSRDRFQEIVGWYQYELNGDIESVAVVPTTKDDRVWIVVNRTINGSTKRYVEYFEDDNVNRYVDSSIYYSGSATRTINGLDHLEGETVSVLGDGSFAGTYTVSSGSITLPDSKTAIEEAYVGLAYQADLEIMPINIPIPQTGGTTQTLQSRINELQLILKDTVTLSAGNSFDNLIDIPFRNVNSQMTTAPATFGATYPDIKQVLFNGTWTRQNTVCIRSDLPFPCTVISLMCRMEVQSQ